MSQTDKYRVVVQEDAILKQLTQPNRLDVCCATTVTGDRCSKHAAIGSIYCLPHIKSITQETQITISNDNGVEHGSLLDHDITPKVLELLKVNLSMPEQRTLEWYELRKTKITASSAAALLLITDYEYNKLGNRVCRSTNGGKILPAHVGKKYCMAFGSYIDEIRKQVLHEPWKQSKYMKHGVKYEPVIRDIYEGHTGDKVLDFGLMPHKTIPWLGASPDGITTNGKMIEIKAPSDRKLTKETILQYWIQMQLQMEVCDLDECEFIEGVIVKYTEAEYYADVHVPDTPDEEPKYFCTREGNPKGIVIKIKTLGPDKKAVMNYAYPPTLTFNSREEETQWITKWVTDKVNEKHDNAYKWFIERQFIEMSLSYYYVKTWITHSITRDREWFRLRKPDLEAQWKCIEQYRKNGLPAMFDKKPTTRKKKDDEWMGDEDDEDDKGDEKKSPLAEYVASTLSKSTLAAAKKDAKTPIPRLNLTQPSSKDNAGAVQGIDIRSFANKIPKTEPKYESDVFTR